MRACTAGVVTQSCGSAGSLEKEVRIVASFRGWKGESDRCKGNPKNSQERAQCQHGMKPFICSHVASTIYVLHTFK